MKIEPFNLSVGKPKVVMEDNFVGGLDIHPYSPSTKPVKPARSTKKFDTYVKFRNEQKIDRQKKEEDKKKEK